MANTLVLIIADEPDTRELIRTVVADSLGYEAVLAAEGVDVLRIFPGRTGRVQPDLICLDLDSAGVNGLEVIRFVRETPATRRIPIIAISAGSGLLNHALALGASAILSKPLDQDGLAAKIAAQLSAE